MVTQCRQAYSKRSSRSPAAADDVAGGFRGEAVKAFRKLRYELDEQTGAISFFEAPIRPTVASPFQTTKNSPNGLFGR